MIKTARVIAGAMLAAMSLAAPASATTILYAETADIPSSSGWSGGGSFLELDINKDGLNDVAFRERQYGFLGLTTAYGRNGGRVHTGPALAQSGTISSGASTQSSANLLGYWNSAFSSRASTFGEWDNGSTGTQTGFLGVTLGTGQLGWVELEINPFGSTNGNGFGRVLGFGYETQPRMSVAAGAAPIATPLPASALLIAPVLIGMGAWGRRKKRAN